MEGVNKSLITRFYKKFKKTQPNDCWDWLASTDSKGRGKIVSYIDGVTYYHIAPRLSFYLHNKIDPKDKYVCHSCDNPTCVNPSHLWLGTHSDNMKDFYKKGGVKSEKFRTRSLIRENGRILTKNSVFPLLAQGMNQKQVAQKLGVSGAAVSKFLKKYKN